MKLDSLNSNFIEMPANPLSIGNLRSGSEQLDIKVALQGEQALSHHILIAAQTGRGKSNLMTCLVASPLHETYGSFLILDPHDEYYGRTGFGLKDHHKRENVRYYTPVNPPPGAMSLKINVTKLKPEHFQGAIPLSDPQRQCLYVYYKKFIKK